MIPHRAVVTTALSLAGFLDAHRVHLDERDTLLSFLPLAHVFDRHSGGPPRRSQLAAWPGALQRSPRRASRSSFPAASHLLAAPPFFGLVLLPCRLQSQARMEALSRRRRPNY